MDGSVPREQTQPIQRTTVTVLIPVYNAESFLHETLASVFAQTRPADEVLVIDDGSTDGTEQVVRSYGDRIRYIKQANQGISGARNTGLREAIGECIALFDHDDLMVPEKLEKQMKVMEADPGLVVAYSTFSYLYDDKSTKAVPAFPASRLMTALRYRTPILPSTAILRRSALLEVGGFRNVFGIDDWDLWSRLIKRYSGSAFQGLDEVLTLYRWHEANTTNKNFLKIAANVLRMADTDLLIDLPPWRRWLWRRRIQSRVYYQLAMRLREIGNESYWAYALESFLQWPPPSSTISNHRYKVFLHMLLQKLRHSEWTLSSWFPARSCRAELEQLL